MSTVTADRETLAAFVARELRDAYGIALDQDEEGWMSDASDLVDALLAGPLASLPESVCPACGATTRAGEQP